MNITKFIPVAEAIATMSRNPKRKIGAILLSSDFNIIATGYNDLSKGLAHSDKNYSQPAKDYMFCHAEENAIAQAARTGAKTNGGMLVVTGLMPCSRCARLIVQAGIKTVYFPSGGDVTQKWSKDFEYSLVILTAGGVEIEQYQ